MASADLKWPQLSSNRGDMVSADLKWVHSSGEVTLLSLHK